MLINSIFVSITVERLENIYKGIFFSYTLQSQRQISDEEGPIQLPLLLQLMGASSQPLTKESSLLQQSSLFWGVFWLHFHKCLISLYQQMLLFEAHGGFLLLSLFVCVKLENMKETLRDENILVFFLLTYFQATSSL